VTVTPSATETAGPTATASATASPTARRVYRAYILPLQYNVAGPTPAPRLFQTLALPAYIVSIGRTVTESYQGGQIYVYRPQDYIWLHAGRVHIQDQSPVYVTERGYLSFDTRALAGRVLSATLALRVGFSADHDTYGLHRGLWTRHPATGTNWLDWEPQPLFEFDPFPYYNAPVTYTIPSAAVRPGEWTALLVRSENDHLALPFSGRRVFAFRQAITLTVTFQP
jgi:hypothetical protein